MGSPAFQCRVHLGRVLLFPFFFQRVQQGLNFGGGKSDAGVRRAIIQIQFVSFEDGSGGEDDAGDEAGGLVGFFGAEHPAGEAADDFAGVVQIQQGQAGAVNGAVRGAF